MSQGTMKFLDYSSGLNQTLGKTVLIIGKMRDPVILWENLFGNPAISYP